MLNNFIVLCDCWLMLTYDFLSNKEEKYIYNIFLGHPVFIFWSSGFGLMYLHQIFHKKSKNGSEFWNFFVGRIKPWLGNYVKKFWKICLVGIFDAINLIFRIYLLCAENFISVFDSIKSELTNNNQSPLEF